MLHSLCEMRPIFFSVRVGACLLLRHAKDRVGDQYIAEVGTWPRRRIGAQGLIQEVGAAIVERFTTRLKITTVRRLKPRDDADD